MQFENEGVYNHTMLTTNIQENLIAALKQKKAEVLSVLRFLLSAIKNAEIEKKTPLSDDEVIMIIRKQIKELNDAKLMFEKGGRDDLATQNETQITILSTYLPAEMSDDDLKKEVDRIIAANKDTYEKNPKIVMGMCMKELRAKVTPQRIARFFE